MPHHPNSLWGIIKRAIKDIETLNGVTFGNETWKIIKRMDSEILAWERRVNAHLSVNRRISQSFNCSVYDDDNDYGHCDADDGYTLCGKPIKGRWHSDVPLKQCPECLKAIKRMQEKEQS